MMQRLQRIELLLSIAIALVIAMSGPGYRFECWPLGTAFMMLRWGAWAALALAALAIITAWLSRRRVSSTSLEPASTQRPASTQEPVSALQPLPSLEPSRRPSLASAAFTVIISLAAAATPLWLAWTGSHAPPIHDITTDFADPPAFIAIAPLRVNARNPVAYEGDVVARQQRAAYPDIAPLELGKPPAEVFRHALAAARSMGWTIIDENPDEGRIEASATTPFFGFVDDVVIRIKPTATGSRVDVRSKSRIGRSDIGANARRVRGYLMALRTAIG